MKDNFQNLVDGTSALKPDCSRYSNENEHIIDFGQAAGARHAARDERDVHALRREARRRLACRLERSETLNELKYGSAVGRPVHPDLPTWKIVLVGSVYALIGFICIFVGL